MKIPQNILDGIAQLIKNIRIYMDSLAAAKNWPSQIDLKASQPPSMPQQQPSSQNQSPSATAPLNASNPDAIREPWSDPVIAHHNVRAICDLEGLSYDQKEILTACVYVESGFHINAKHVNHNGQGQVTSTDFGICQWNDVYHGKEITPNEALNNPEKAVRLMCQYFKAGKQSQWVSYSSGAYKRWLGKV